MLNAIMVDTHTHTVLSGHAWSTLRENAAFAAQRGMAGLCLTEHAHSLPGAGPFFLPSAQRMLPGMIEGVRIWYGIEANIINLAGGLDIDDKALFSTEFCIASMHDICCRPGTPAENTSAYLAALQHPCVDILGHIDDRRTPNDFETVVAEAKKRDKLIEINNNSLLIRKGSLERVEEVARLCLKHGTRVAVSSDAHFDQMVGEVRPALELLAKIAFPDELVVNRTLESFEAYLAERTARTEAVRADYLSAGVSARRFIRGM